MTRMAHFKNIHFESYLFQFISLLFYAYYAYTMGPVYIGCLIDSITESWKAFKIIIPLTVLFLFSGSICAEKTKKCRGKQYYLMITFVMCGMSTGCLLYHGLYIYTLPCDLEYIAFWYPYYAVINFSFHLLLIYHFSRRIEEKLLVYIWKGLNIIFFIYTIALLIRMNVYTHCNTSLNESAASNYSMEVMMKEPLEPTQFGTLPPSLFSFSAMFCFFIFSLVHFGFLSAVLICETEMIEKYNQKLDEVRRMNEAHAICHI